VVRSDHATVDGSNMDFAAISMWRYVSLIQTTKCLVGSSALLHMQFILSKIKLLNDISIHSSHVFWVLDPLALKKILWTTYYIHTSKLSSTLMNFGHFFQLKGRCPVLLVSSLVIMESAFTLQNTVMTTQTAKISLMNLTVVSYLLILHAFDDKM
jgi:hypothetical protein